MGANSTRRLSKMRALHRLQDGRCGLCGSPVLHPDERQPGDFVASWGPSIDHVVPRSKGGSVWALSNMLLAHRGCNERRRNGRLPDRAHKVWKANVAKIAEGVVHG